MSIQPLNYCRQMVRQYQLLLAQPGVVKEPAHMHRLIDLARTSVKYILPPGGRVLIDESLRALDGMCCLRLPHKRIALEYSAYETRPLEPGEEASSRRIVFVEEGDDEVFRCTIACYFDRAKLWAWLPDFGIPMRDGLVREDGTAGLKYRYHLTDPSLPFGDFADEAAALLQFLNVLACSNVHTERIEPSKLKQQIARDRRDALPFDTYHVLTIDAQGSHAAAEPSSATHRSPREHLRRGHIRRLADGRRIWVNATVVAAGRGAGVVSKDYAVRQSAIR